MIESPYKDDKDRWEVLTVYTLKKMLKDIPDDYEIMYDGFCGEIHKGDLAIDHETREISING